jgi:hypothetical protein
MGCRRIHPVHCLTDQYDGRPHRRHAVLLRVELVEVVHRRVLYHLRRGGEEKLRMEEC